MATVNFLYRSKRPEAFLNLRLLFRYNSKDYSIGGKTKLKVSKGYWFNSHTKNTKDAELKELQNDIGNKLYLIEKHVLEAFNNSEPSQIDSKWLTTTIENYYNPPTTYTKWPIDLIGYLEKFIELKIKTSKPQTIKNYNVVKNLLLRYEQHTGQKVLIPGVGIELKNSFEDYCISQKYSGNTINKAIRTIKTVCKDAFINGVEINRQLDAIKLKTYTSTKIYLSIDEITEIEKIKNLPNYLENAKDWLIISCFTGQRISDFMRFNKNQIRTENNYSFIDFKQVKTDKLMTIPLHKKVLEILEKRDGEFPQKISDQKYNDYIKIVCEEAKINEVIKGKKAFNISKDKKVTQIRKIEGNYKKHDLVASHIGRRSFATNFYGKMPIAYLKNITGHTTEKMLLTYIGKSSKDLAYDSLKYFD